MTAGRYEGASGKGRAVPKRRPLILFLWQHVIQEGENDTRLPFCVRGGDYEPSSIKTAEGIDC
jgi:hypothetical protein